MRIITPQATCNACRIPTVATVAAVQTRDESMVPLSINCWPSVSGGESYVNIEYESSAPFDLQNVVIEIPLPALSHAPRVTQVRLRGSRVYVV